jgi:hypothetical protein
VRCYLGSLDAKPEQQNSNRLVTSQSPAPVAIPLFETHVSGFFPYDVAPDGRFLLNTVIQDAAANASPITVVLNWTARLKK